MILMVAAFGASISFFVPFADWGAGFRWGAIRLARSSLATSVKGQWTMTANVATSATAVKDFGSLTSGRSG